MYPFLAQVLWLCDMYCKHMPVPGKDTKSHQTRQGRRRINIWKEDQTGNTKKTTKRREEVTDTEAMTSAQHVPKACPCTFMCLCVIIYKHMSVQGQAWD